MIEVDPKERFDDLRIHGNFVLVREYPKKEVSDGGLAIPDKARERRLAGWVVAIGDKVESPLQLGDTVLYSALAPWTIPELGNDIQMLRENDAALSIPKE